ncbi:MAG: hypothetical protein K2Y26_08365, partial [Gemmatimonadaceae bacterium]|nr:hypothetical protein [Gemmatimonadaceae bacterium]
MPPLHPTDPTHREDTPAPPARLRVHWQHPRSLMHDMAQALSPAPSRPPLGDITLRDHQHEAVAQLTRILAEYRGALLADDVGLGKTFVALAVSRQYDTVHVVAPVTLLPTWRSAAA